MKVDSIMNNNVLRHDRAKRTLSLICWCFAIGLCVMAWTGGVPRLARGLQAWQAGGSEATVSYEPGRYKGSPTGGWSEPAHSAIEAGLGWCAVAAAMTGGMAWTYVARRPRFAQPAE